MDIWRYDFFFLKIDPNPREKKTWNKTDNCTFSDYRLLYYSFIFAKKSRSYDNANARLKAYNFQST